MYDKKIKLMVYLFQRTNTVPHVKNFMWLSYVGLATAFYYYFSKFFLAHLLIYICSFKFFTFSNYDFTLTAFLKKKIKLYFNQLLTNKYLAKSYIQNSYSAVEQNVHVDQPYFLKFIYFSTW